jgi:hypothetical protein
VALAHGRQEQPRPPVEHAVAHLQDPHSDDVSRGRGRDGEVWVVG